MTIPVVGRDLAKNVVQAHGVDAQGRPRLGSKLRRGEVLPFPPSCPKVLVGIEACHTAR